MSEASSPRRRGRGSEAWRPLLARFGVELRPGEGLPAFLLFSSFFLIISFQYAAKSVRQSAFISSLGAVRLPYVYMAVALASYPLLRAYAWLADRWPRHAVMVGTCCFSALGTAVFWWLFRYPWDWVAATFFVWISIVSVLVVSQFWSYSSHVFDSRQARRLFGLLGAGGLLGGIAGGQVARLVTVLAGTRHALLAAAMLLLGVTASMALVHRVQPLRDEASPGAATADLEAARGGLAEIRGSRLLRLIAGIMVLTVIVAQIVDLQFSWAAEQATSSLDERTAFFGNFYSVMGISAFLFQLVFTSRIHRALGVGVALRVLPVTMGVGTLALLLGGSVLPAALLTGALLLKIGENGLRYSLDQATRELLFVPVPSRARLKAKPFIDVFVQRSAKGLAAIVLLPVTFGLMSPLATGWISAVLVLVWLAVSLATQREYVRVFRQGLREGAVDAAIPISLADVTTLELLVQSLGSADARQVLHGLDLLAAHGRGNLVPPLLLYHDDPQVRHRTLRILADARRADAVPLVGRLLSDGDAEVRAEAVRVLATLLRQEARDLMLPRLREADPRVRAAAVACLLTEGDVSSRTRARDALAEMMSDGEPRARAEAASALGAVPEPDLQAELLRLLYDPSPRVARAAIAAVERRVSRDGWQPLYAPTLVALLRNRRLKHDAREALVTFGERVVPALVHFLDDPEEDLWVRRALPRTLARIGTAGALEALLASLSRADDSFLRHKLIEAIVECRTRAGVALGHAAVEGQIRVEARRYFQALGELADLGFDGRGRLEGPRVVWDDERPEPSFLHRCLAERADDSLRNLFGLLSTLLPARDVRAVHRSLLGADRALRARALEYLDNTLSGELRRLVFAVVDDRPLPEKRRLASRTFGLAGGSRQAVVARYLEERAEARPTEARRAFALAALDAVCTERLEPLYPRVVALAASAEDPWVREAAAWVALRLRPAGTLPTAPI